MSREEYVGDGKAYLRSQLRQEDWEALEHMDLAMDWRAATRMWPKLVNLEKRMEKEVPFLLGKLTQHEDPLVLNAALGSGATTIGLARAGIARIVSNDIDEAFIAVAREEAVTYGVALDITRHDWRSLPQEWTGKFDAIVNLGNSLTHLFRREDLERSVREFHRVLAPGGMLILDERNYEHLFLHDPSGGAYSWSGEVVYCGKDQVDVRPAYISQGMVVMAYTDKSNGNRTHLVMNPFKEGEVRGLLVNAGFRDITTYGDYKSSFKPEEPEFLTHIARK